MSARVVECRRGLAVDLAAHEPVEPVRPAEQQDLPHKVAASRGEADADNNLAQD